jgi:hypothetical protein
MRKETNARSWIRSRRTEATAKQRKGRGGRGRARRTVRCGGIGKERCGGRGVNLNRGFGTGPFSHTPSFPSRPVTPAPFLGPATNS